MYFHLHTYVDSTGDVNSNDHKALHSDRLNEDSMHVENISVQTIIDDDGASVYKANKLSLSDHYDATSRRRLVVISQAVTAKQLNKIIDVTGMHVVYTCTVEITLLLSTNVSMY